MSQWSFEDLAVNAERWAKNIQENIPNDVGVVVVFCARLRVAVVRAKLVVRG